MSEYFRGKPMRVGQTPQYPFADDVVEDRWNLRRVVHRPTKFPGNPVMVPDGVYEYNCYESHVWRDPETGRFHNWYQDADLEAAYRGHEAESGSAEGHPDFCRYAHSEDGVNWVKPKLGLLQHGGTKENNIVLAGNYECDRSAVVLNSDPNDVQRKFIMAYLDRVDGQSGFCLAYSPDGTRFTPEPKNPVVAGHFDCVNTPVWDPINRYWLWYSRPTVHAYGFAPPTYKWRDIDYEGGKSRHHRRRVCVAVSEDLVNWSKPRTCLYADELDGEWTDIDHFRPWYQNGMFFGNASYVDQEVRGKPGHLMLVWSRDGFTWHRPHDREWFIGRGPEGAFDDGWVLGASAPVFVGNEMWFYYAGQPYNEKANMCLEMSVGLAKLSRDWFMSQEAGMEEGFLLTREVVIDGSRLELNFSTFQQGPTKTAMADMGQITVELVESLTGRDCVVGGKPIEGFAFKDCDPVRGNRVDWPVTWNGNGDLSQLKGRPVHLRFRLKIANLFTFAFKD
ncbi:MAG: hypothetical protein CMJ18_02930 [Phycisphaeraceae bacterium]|nr:hypothetical protein [Phycisphaeraceae bacterium]